MRQVAVLDDYFSGALAAAGVKAEEVVEVEGDEAGGEAAKADDEGTEASAPEESADDSDE